ncbi:MAG: endonuclease/exonuclease/phosphatase family protein [Verrucomicrobiales bacterium]|nr:endonuclease/exonuclease/phosphatase family protein [Verrucomicrobiales bacterium]
MRTQPPDQKLKSHVSWSGLLESAALVGWLATLAGFLGSWNWLPELASHFRVQLAIAFALLTLLTLLGRPRRASCVAAGLGVLVNGGLVLWEARPVGQPRDPAGDVIRLLSINVNTANRRSDLVLKAIGQADPDVILLMEVDPRWMKDLAPLRTRYPFRLEEARTDNFGIALLSRLPLDEGRVEELSGTEVPSILAAVRTPHGVVHLAGTHPLPPGSREDAAERNRQLDALAERAAAHPQTSVILGDLNITPWSPHFPQLLRAGHLLRAHPGWGVFATWQVDQPWFSLPLDHCLVSPSIAVRRLEVGPDVGSDHRPLLAELAVPPR